MSNRPPLKKGPPPVPRSKPASRLVEKVKALEEDLKKQAQQHEEKYQALTIMFEDEKQELEEIIRGLKEKLDSSKSSNNKSDMKVLMDEIKYKDSIIDGLRNEIAQKDDQIESLRKELKNGKKSSLPQISKKVTKQPINLPPTPKIKTNVKTLKTKLVVKNDSSKRSSTNIPKTSDPTSSPVAEKKKKSIFNIFKKKGKKDSKRRNHESYLASNIIPFDIKRVELWETKEVTKWLSEIEMPKDFIKFVKDKKVTGKGLFGIKKDSSYLKKLNSKGRIKFLINCAHVQRTHFGDKTFAIIINKLIDNKRNIRYNNVVTADIERFGSTLSTSDAVRKHVKKILSMKERNTFPVKLLITSSVYMKKPLREFINPKVVDITEDTSEVFYSAVMIGPVILEWSEFEIVFPRHLHDSNDENNVLGIEVGELANTNENISKIIDIIFKWNISKKYSKKKSNCQHFVEDVLSTLRISVKYEKTVEKYIKQIKKNGECFNLPLELKDVEKWKVFEVTLWLGVIGVKKYFEKNNISFSMNGKELLKLSYTSQLIEKIQDDQVKRKVLVNLCHLKKNYEKGINKFSRGFSAVTNKIFLEKVTMEYKAMEFFISCLSNKQMLEKNYLKKKLHQNDYLVKIAQIPKSELEKHSNDSDNPRLKVKIIITEIAFSKKEKLIRSIISPMMTTFTLPTKMNSEFGLFHTAILIGPFYLEWTKSSVIIPKRISSANALLSFDVDVLDVKEDVNTITSKIAEIIIKWNTRYRYTKSKGHNKGNCQDFIDDVVQKLEINTRVEKGTIFSDFLDEMRKKGTSEINFRPNPKFIKFFKLRENPQFDKYKTSDGMYKIHFETHEVLDDFCHEISTNCLRNNSDTIERLFPWEVKLLKAFDRAFWLRWIKSNEQDLRYKPSMKVLKYGSVRKCGCPFCDPRDTYSYQ